MTIAFFSHNGPSVSQLVSQTTWLGTYYYRCQFAEEPKFISPIPQLVTSIITVLQNMVTFYSWRRCSRFFKAILSQHFGDIRFSNIYLKWIRLTKNVQTAQPHLAPAVVTILVYIFGQPRFHVILERKCEHRYIGA